MNCNSWTLGIVVYVFIKTADFQRHNIQDIGCTMTIAVCDISNPIFRKEADQMLSLSPRSTTQTQCTLSSATGYRT